MSYERHFIGPNAHQEGLAAAIEWCSAKQMMTLRQCLAGGMKIRYFRKLCAFTGFSGYPVRALLKEHHSRYVRHFGPKSLQSEDVKAEAYSNEEFR